MEGAIGIAGVLATLIAAIPAFYGLVNGQGPTKPYVDLVDKIKGDADPADKTSGSSEAPLPTDAAERGSARENIYASDDQRRRRMGRRGRSGWPLPVRGRFVSGLIDATPSEVSSVRDSIPELQPGQDIDITARFECDNEVAPGDRVTVTIMPFVITPSGDAANPAPFTSRAVIVR